MGQKKEKIISYIINSLVLWFGSIIMVLPLLWCLSVALKSSTIIFELPPQWIPKEFIWSNFPKSLEYIDFWPRFMNSLFIACMSILGQLISCTLVGYAFARLRFPLKKMWFYFTVGSMMIPGVVSLIPMFKLYSSIGWLNTFYPLIVPSFLGSPFYIFLLRQFMMGIPFSYDEAAKIDGANHLQVLFQIITPLLKPALVVIVIMQFQASWNDYLNPLLYLIKPEKWTLSVAIAQLVTEWRIDWNYFMAADIIYMLPILIIYFAGQKYFMQGLGSLNTVGVK